MDSTTYQLIAADVSTAARSVAREWPGVITQDDVEQQIWVILLESSQEAQGLVAGMDKPQRVSTLKTYGHRIAARERDDYDLFSGNFYYGTQEVRDLLEQGGLEGWHPTLGAIFDPDKIDDPNERDREEAIQIADLAVGMERLTKKNAVYADLIRRRYLFGVTVDDGSKGKNLTRAVDALTLEMNRYHRSGGAV